MTSGNLPTFFQRTFTVATLNVRGLSARTKRDTLVHDLLSHEVDVCTLQETKISAGIDKRCNGYRILPPLEQMSTLWVRLCFVPSCGRQS